MAVLIFFNKMRWDSNVSLDLFDLSNRNIILKIYGNKGLYRGRGREEGEDGKRGGREGKFSCTCRES